MTVISIIIKRTYESPAVALQGKQRQLRNEEYDDMHLLRLCLLIALPSQGG